MPLAISPTFSPWAHTSDDSYIYQLSLVLATATVSFSLTVVSAVFGGCKTASGGSPSSTGFEPGADEVAYPSASSPLLLAAELVTTLLPAALGFPSKWLIVLLDHAKRDVGR